MKLAILYYNTSTSVLLKPFMYNSKNHSLLNDPIKLFLEQFLNHLNKVNPQSFVHNKTEKSIFFY